MSILEHIPSLVPFESFMRKLDRNNNLTERQYTSPSTGGKLMFDFYALYSVWWDKGSGKQVYNYTPDIANHKLASRIDRTFTECAWVTADLLVKGARFCIYDEALNAFDPHLISTDAMLEWVSKRPFRQAFLERDGSLKEMEDVTEEDFWHCSYKDAESLFDDLMWDESPLYGGSRWSSIVLMTARLHEALKQSNLARLVAVIDAVYDMEHNTGALVDKMPAESRVKKQELDIRAAMRSTKGFLPYVSEPVAQLIHASQLDPQRAS